MSSPDRRPSRALPLSAFALSLSLSALALPAARGATFVWDASSGFGPDAVPQGMTLFDDATQNPSLSGGTLTLSTTGLTSSMYYLHAGAEIALFGLPQIETSMRFVSGTFSGGRAPAMISFGVGAGAGANILFKQDLVQSSDAAGSTIRQSASVDTDGAFHTYLIAMAGTNAGDSFTVYQDSNPILTDTLLTSIPAFGTTPNVAFGDLTSIAGGTSEWKTFSHNMLVPEPGSLLLTTLGALPLLSRRRRGSEKGSQK